MGIAFDWYFEDQKLDSVSDRAERALLGSIVACPYLLEFAAILRAADFRYPPWGAALTAMRSLGERYDPIELAHEIERSCPPPAGMGWVGAVHHLEDDSNPDDESLRAYVRIIQEAAARRRVKLLKPS